MATIIDSLAVVLGLDNKTFKKGIKESEKVQDDFEKRTNTHQKKSAEQDKKLSNERKRSHSEEVHQHKETLENYKKMREDVLKFILIFTAGKGIFDFIGETIRTSVAIGHLSNNLDVSVEHISGWQFAMQEMGGSAEDATAMLSKAGKAVADMKSGIDNADIHGFWTGLGGTASVDTSKMGNNAEEFLKAEADILKFHWEHNKDLYLTKLGLMNLTPEQGNLLRRGSAYVSSRVDKGAALSGRNKSQVEIAEKAQKDWTALVTRLEAIGRDILFPIMNSVMTWLNNPENTKELRKNLTDFVAALKAMDWKEVATKLGVLIDVLGTVVGLLSRFLPGKNTASDLNLAVETARKDSKIVDYTISTAELIEQVQDSVAAFFNAGDKRSFATDNVLKPMKAYGMNRSGNQNSNTTTSTATMGDVNVTIVGDPKDANKTGAEVGKVVKKTFGEFAVMSNRG